MTLIVPEPQQLHAIAQFLANQLRTQSGCWRRAEAVIPDAIIHFQGFLQVPIFPKLYFRSREKNHAPFVTLGSVLAGKLDVLSELLHELPFRSVLYGGRSFSGTEGVKEWSGFPGEIFFLPLVVIHQTDFGCRIICHAEADNLPNSGLICEILDKLISKKEDIIISKNDDSKVIIYRHNPSAEQWAKSIADCLRIFEDNYEIQKVVFARKTDVLIHNDWLDFLWNFVTMSDEKRFAFVFQPSEAANYFVGSSPELLYWRTRNTVFTEALAGTRPRVGNSTLDQQYASELEKSLKEQVEHKCVVDFLREAFEQIACESIQITDSRQFALENLRHLKTELSAKIKSKIRDVEILNLLHPTPAVCGYPREVARKVIQQFEAFDRGWYAGTLGWVSQSEAEFCVTIRSMLLSGQIGHVYTGAGIVQGSNPYAEWDELNQKLQNVFPWVKFHG